MHFSLIQRNRNQQMTGDNFSQEIVISRRNKKKPQKNGITTTENQLKLIKYDAKKRVNLTNKRFC